MCKRTLSLISLVLVLTLAGTASAGLIAQWKFDEGSGTLATDSTGNGHDGTLEGDPQWVDGYFAGGLQFAGSPDRVVVPYSADLNPEEAFTVSVWANVEPGSSGWRSPITSRDDGPQRGYIIYAGTDGNWQFWIGTGGGWSNAAGPPIQTGEWTHVAATYVPGEQKLYINGELAGEAGGTIGLNTQQYLSIGAGRTDWPQGDYFFAGVIDDVRLYDHAMSAEDVAASMENQGGAIVKAYGADPKNGAMLEATWVNLSWKAGDFAVSHDVYMGDNFDDVNNGTADTFQGNQASTMLIAGFTGFAFPEGLVPGTTYYWRVDEVNPDDPNSPWKGDVWSFWIPPKVAWQPAPADGLNYVATDAELSWTSGFGAQLHTVYFGESLDEVSNATGGAAQTGTTFDPGPLANGTVYYWRVDEFEAPVTHKGDVWSFTTLPVVEVTDANRVGWWTLDEGQGATAVDWSGHGNHGTLTDGPQWVDGGIGLALAFDDGRVTIDASDSLSADLFQGSFTLAGWINPTRTGNTWQQIFRGVSPAGSNDTLFLNNDGRLSWRGRVDGAWAGGMCETVANVVPVGQWTHVAVTGDGTSFRIYVDGTLSQESAFQTTDGANETYYIGGAAAGSESYLGMVDDLGVYDRVLTEAEIQEAMRGDLLLAWDPQPQRNATVDIRDIDSLNWSAGDRAVSHDVYFGTDRDAVAGAGSDSPEFQGNQAGTSLSLASLVGFGGGDYYWRIDEVAADGTVTAGTIWKFTVPDYLVVDDFESYNDINEDEPGSNRIYLTWIDGFGTTTNGAVAGNLDVPFMSAGRSGGQAMPLSYDNAGKTSEATMTLASKKDWTVHGVTKLVVWFSGDSANAADRMFVALGNAVVYHPDDAVTQDTGWNEWVIDLTEFAGVDLANVPSITLGFGTRGAPVATGGIGTVDIDDIRLIH